MDSLAEVAAVAHRGSAVLVNTAAVPSARLSFEAEAGAPTRGYDVIPASHGTISVRQQEIQTPVHNKHQIELHCGKLLFLCYVLCYDFLCD